MHVHLPVRRPVRRPHTARAAAAALLSTVLLGASACSSADEAVVGAVDRDATHLTVTDAWVKAAPSGMTGAFATLANDGDSALRLASVTTDRAGTVELHETVTDGSGGTTMRPRKGGFTIAAHGTRRLAPGGDHVMLMGLTGALAPGEQVELVLHLGDGSTRTVTALVKDFTGADEKYAGSTTGSTATPSGMGSMPGMSSTSDE